MFLKEKVAFANVKLFYTLPTPFYTTEPPPLARNDRIEYIHKCTIIIEWSFQTYYCDNTSRPRRFSPIIIDKFQINYHKGTMSRVKWPSFWSPAIFFYIHIIFLKCCSIIRGTFLGFITLYKTHFLLFHLVSCKINTSKSGWQSKCDQIELFLTMSRNVSFC